MPSSRIPGRDFTADELNEPWLTDLTVHPTPGGKLYICQSERTTNTAPCLLVMRPAGRQGAATAGHLELQGGPRSNSDERLRAALTVLSVIICIITDTLVG